MEDGSDELQESELGTKEYWDNRYQLEVENFKNYGDPGEVWFGEDIVDRTVKWLETHPNTVSKDAKILDLGCGNGMFLIELANEGYTNLYGVDYCKDAIKLAKSIAEQKDFKIDYYVCDILDDLQSDYDVIHDKGTYDAISLANNPRENRNKYLKNVEKSLNSNGVFIITSCNWTREELDKHFENYFTCYDVIPTPQFKFGGRTGNIVTSLIYKKKNKH